MKAETEKGIILSEKIKIYDSLFMRVKGLMFRKSLEDNSGIIIVPCNSIHTFFMRFNIDVIFLDSENKIVKIVRNLRPWRMTRMYLKAKKVIELNGGELPENIKEGEKVKFYV